MPALALPSRRARTADLAECSVAELGDLFARGAVSPVEVAQLALDRIARFDGAVNAFVLVDRDTTLAMARASEARHRAGDARGPLDGVPVSIKDLTPVAGWPLRRGSAALDATTPAPTDSPPVMRLREAGAVFIGKTATPESGSRIVTRSAVHGVTRNPYDLAKTPGGSSGGAAAALALRIGTLALGTDGAGSIRIPSSFCNLVGLKPTFGRVPSYPPSIFMPHSVTGPMARRVTDLAVMLEVLARPEPRDPYAWPVAHQTPTDLAAPDLAGVRVALSLSMGMRDGDTDPEVVAAVRKAAAALSARGASLEVADPVWPVDPYEPFVVLWAATYAAFLDTYPPEAVARMDPLLQSIAARGHCIDILTYHRALAQRLAIAAAARDFFNRFDLLVTPVMPTPPFDAQREAPPGREPDDWRWCPFTYVWNMTGQPAMAVPAGFTRDGLPLGAQIVARAGEEALLLRAGAAVESSGLIERRPSLLDASQSREA